MRASFDGRRVGSVELVEFLPAAILSLVTALVQPPREDVSAQPQDGARARPALQSRRITQPPIIDGVLDDDAWREGPVDTGDWLSYNPLYGTSIPQKTKVWIGHDTNYLYSRVPV